MKLVENKPAPCFGKSCAGIFDYAEHVGCHRGTLGSVGKLLVLTVVEFHRSRRRVATCAVHIHQQFAVEARQFGVLVERHEVFIHAVARRAYYLQRPVGCG